MGFESEAIAKIGSAGLMFSKAGNDVFLLTLEFAIFVIL